MTGPLEGIKVLDISTILAGPLVAQILGDFGAEVIKIEHPTKPDGMRGHGLDKDGHPLWWTMIGRNKRTVTLDLGNSRGGAIFRRLAAEADVVVENFRPGTLERWGLGYDVLSELNPGLILLRVTGFGQTGPYATRPAFGTLVESMSGFAHLTGEADGPPTLPAFGLADSLAGIAGSSAVSMALLHRTNNGGKGQQIDLDLLSPIMAAVGPGVIYADQLGIDQERTGNRSSNNAPRNLYKTADGYWLAISTSANSIAERVLVLVGHPEVLDEPWFATGRQRAAHADLLDEYVGGWIAKRTKDVVIDEFEKAGAAVAPVYKPSDLLSDPQVNAIEMVTTVEDDDLGPVRMQNVMWRMGGSPGRIRYTGRKHGADTDQVLTEIGCSADEIEAMHRDSIV
ncbi:acyl-CoA transferase [Rhodococcus sp. 06-418-5]|uniref:CaiB/BaiF CoA transferase family protein n=1 Tax=unclassified Rhodococcus (in: high G+C Gram-positive bacteria) TaxID=192944 RepID=UPI000B9AF1B3|nr:MULTISPECIES: CoA transferase [unclassified Rhodococcus (in: high G+C Gram-positive bacteria)]OZC78967.1 acyl-CoA transferase [Rhodococcus sp. 06-418-5]OZE08568.1 acyl-CoA transferase [Rhodococcus sp. 05-2255-3B1]OZE15721.1 acyl-CoA transferase [Rhodococcus sp. 05-2255-3C]OZE22809.1 acyl-CoA transferase [Rhodococcus sp. 05-2255-2A2]OZF29765.1 acyl-CoA transferase [Rhodococcus sp. 14-2496-1d]